MSFPTPDTSPAPRRAPGGVPGGVAGRVQALGETFVSVEIADGVVAKIQKQSIASVLPKGSLSES